MGIGDGNNGVVEGGADMGNTGLDVFPVAAFGTNDFGLRLCHCGLSLLLTSSCSLQYDEDPCAYERLF
ncbi:hypothetical protein D3C76_1768590 [compost metagenome]